jgi:mitogen-activated protein kinase 15
MDEEALDLVRRMLLFNPKHRISVEDALRHPYMRDFHVPQEELEYNGVIEISIDENTKYSIKEYREALYKEVTKKKSRETRVLTEDNQMVNLQRKREEQRR